MSSNKVACRKSAAQVSGSGLKVCGGLDTNNLVTLALAELTFSNTILCTRGVRGVHLFVLGCFVILSF